MEIPDCGDNMHDASYNVVNGAGQSYTSVYSASSMPRTDAHYLQCHLASLGT